MSTKITADNGAEIQVGQLGITVDHPEGIASIWARLSDAQRVELAAALDSGRRGLHVRLDNQAATLATYRCEREEALRKKGEAFDRAVRAERERDAAVARAEQAEQLIPAYAMLDVWGALGRDSIHFDDWYDEHGYADAWAELTAAVREARTAPAVDRDLVEATLADGLHRGLTIDQLARSVCAAINGEPAPDPVEELAGEIDGAVRDAVRKGFDFIDSVTGIEVDQKVVDAMLTWLPSESRALARRAFGQEADR